MNVYTFPTLYYHMLCIHYVSNIKIGILLYIDLIINIYNIYNKILINK